MGSNHVTDKSLFPWARNFTLIAQYCLVPGMYLKVCLYAYGGMASYTNKWK
jgi:hypothetical protein